MLTIKQRQMNLKFLGYYEKLIDGIEGTGTKQAYKDFQKAYGLVVDGIYGEKTNDKLIEVIKKEQEKLGVNPDGIAGAITNKARENQESWDNIKYFKKSEFACKCGCGLNNIDIKLVKVLDEIREHFGKPCVITSGCRCMLHNKRVKGSEKSRHMLGKAADIFIKDTNKNSVLLYAGNLKLQGKIRYAYTNNSNMLNAVHIDIL